jgi:hypothetical protein
MLVAKEILKQKENDKGRNLRTSRRKKNNRKQK